MTAKLKKAAGIFVAVVLLFGIVGCGGKEQSGTDDPDNSGTHTGEDDVPVVEETDAYFIQNGKTEYIIVYPENIGNVENRAVNELIDLYYEATGEVIGSIDDSDISGFNEEMRYLSLGSNKLSVAAGIEADKEIVGSNGYRIHTKGNSVFMLGGGPWGTIYAVYEFLNLQLGYEFYCDDEIVFNEQKTDTCKLIDVDMNVKPSVEWRMSGMGEVLGSMSYRMRLREQAFSEVWMSNAEIGVWHNFFNYVPVEKYLASHPDWYNSTSNPTTFCFSRDVNGLKAVVVEQMKKLIEDNPYLEYLTFTQPDFNDWCECSACKAAVRKYGAESSTQILFMNKVAEEIGAWLKNTYPERSVYLYMFAYFKTLEAPVRKNAAGEWEATAPEMVLADNCGVFYCTQGASGAYDINDPINAKYATLYDQWRSLTKNLAVWDYGIDSNNYFAPFYRFNAEYGSIKKVIDSNGKLYFDMAAYGSKTSNWSRLFAYFESQLMWNIDTDANKLFDKFFENYFKEAAQPMREWFEAYSLYATIHDNNVSSMPQTTLDFFLQKANEAYENILIYKYSDEALYQKLYDRITLETISIRYLYIRDYSYAVQDLSTYCAAMKSDIYRLELEKFSEFITIEQYIDSLPA